jgi:HAMP domain
MREGDFSRPVPIVTRDELAAVARAFNELADKVAALRPPEVAPRDGAVPPRVDP